MKIIHLIFIFVIWVYISYAAPSQQNSNNPASITVENINASTIKNAVSQAMDEAEAKKEAEQEESKLRDDAFRSKNAEQNQIIADATWWMMIITAVNVCVTIIFAYVAFGQWRHSERSVQVAEAAYIISHKMGLKKSNEGIHGLEHELKNTGNTPAYDIRIFGHLDYKPMAFIFTQSEAIETVVHQPTPSMLGRDEVGNNTLGFYSETVSIDDYEIKAAQDEFLHYWGVITYQDVFGRKRWMEFCYVRHEDTRGFKSTQRECSVN